jgi:hypothetical protein
MDTARVAFHSHAYAILMEEARSAMPSETLGLLFGTARASGYVGLNWAKPKNLRITVKEAVPVRLASRGDTLERHTLSPKLLGERAATRGHGLKLVGWFYADPGIGIFPPRISVEEIQRNLPDNADLFLLVNPSTDQGAFYSWNGRQYVPHAGFDEALPGPEPAKESATPLADWNDEVRGFGACDARWFGTLLAEVPPDASDGGDMPDSQWMGPAVPASVGGEAIVEERESDSGSDEDDVPSSAPGGGGLPAQDESAPLQHAPQGDYPSFAGSEPALSEAKGPFAPIYVEVITEEPVEYLAPELPNTTGLNSAQRKNLTPPTHGPEPAKESDAQAISAETQPYPILSEEAGPGHAGDAACQVLATGPLGPDPNEEYGSESAAIPGPLDTGRSISAGKATGPLELEEETAPGHTPPERTGYGPVTRKLETTGDTGPQSGHSFSSGPMQLAAQAEERTAIMPVARSPVRPVMKQRGWRELLHVLSGLAVVAAVAVFLLAGLVAQNTAPTSHSPFVPMLTPPVAENSSLAQNNANPPPASTVLPAVSGATETAIVTATMTTALPGVEK